MNDLIDSIRAALAPGATPEAKGKGMDACRAILAALGASPGEPMSAVVPANPVAALVGALRGVPPDQLLDLAIAKLRAALPAGVEAATATPLKFHIVPLPSRG